MKRIQGRIGSIRFAAHWRCAATFRAALVPVLLLTSAGCLQEMADQPRLKPLGESRFFLDGRSSRTQLAGTIARGQIWEETAEITGREEGEVVERIPVEVTDELLIRGQKQYQIFCSHCHGPAGFGDGMVVQRGFPRPPSFHIQRAREVPDGQVFIQITEGLGRMPAFGKTIQPHDRWALVAYVRALQLSQHLPADQLTEQEQQELLQAARENGIRE